MEKELLFEGRVNASSVNIGEFSPQGARLDITAAGNVSGKVTGLMMTTHNAVMKPDGTGEADVRSMIFSNGEPILVWGKATGKMVDPTPIQKIEENLTFQTPSQRRAVSLESARIELISEQFHEIQCTVRSGSLTAMRTTRIENTGKVDSECEITVTKNGPYFISGKLPISEQVIIVNKEGIPIKWREGKKYPLQEKCSLCRCGESKNKPFCDGAHTRIGFDGTEVAAGEPYLRNAKIIQGPSLKLTDFVDLCVSARFCDRAGGIWTLIPRSDGLDAKRVAVEEGGDCPSGRLVVWDNKTKKALEPRLKKSIGLVEDPKRKSSGPIWVRGGIPIRSADGKTYEVRNRVTLCRCGKSSNKPFCDSSHFPEYR